MTRSPEGGKPSLAVLQFSGIVVGGFRGFSHPGKKDPILMPALNFPFSEFRRMTIGILKHLNFFISNMKLIEWEKRIELG